MTIYINCQHQVNDLHFDFQLMLPSDQITAIFGRSGSGKSTLINMISGLLTPDQGQIIINKQILFDGAKQINVASFKRNIGYVFQDARLFPHYSILGNLRYGITKNDPDHFNTIVELLSLKHLLKRFPISLSGGERQRVAIARALLIKPKLLLMDEPLASLDLPRKKEIMPFLEKLTRTVKIPILYVTHSMQEILHLAQNIVIIDQQKVVAYDELTKVWNSDLMYPWHSFSEYSYLFNAQILSHHKNYALTCVALSKTATLWVQKINATLHTWARVQIRTNDISITRTHANNTSIRNILAATIKNIAINSFQEDRESALVTLDLGDNCYLGATITLWALNEMQLKVGDSVFAQIKGVSVTQRDISIYN